MKVMILFQRLIALIIGCFGLLLMLSETPISSNLSDQAWLTVGGLTIMLVCVGWLWLTGWEEKFVETRKKTL